jgi:hypothetical protein
MKTQTIRKLASCLVAAAVALTTTAARSQHVHQMEGSPIEFTGQAGDMSCSSCGSTVSEDGGLLQGKCPNCGGGLSGGMHGGGQGGGQGGQGGGLLGRLRNGNGAGESQIQERGYGQPDLFYNYYTQGFANRANAQMYVSPVPVPPNVGHTYYTYQPFLPQHMMYPHVDKYHRYYDNGRGMNRTKASYWTSAHAKTKNFYWNFLRIPR